MAVTTSWSPEERSKPAIPNTTRKATVMTPATLNARFADLPTLSSPAPRKNDRYAGSKANPHGFTVATRPATNAETIKAVMDTATHVSDGLFDSLSRDRQF